MAGGRPYSPERFAALLHHAGCRPFRSGRLGLAVVLWRSDFDAYARLGKSITGATYVAAPAPGTLPSPRRGLLRALRRGWYSGGVEHRIRAGRMTARDARWLERQWRGRVPV